MYQELYAQILEAIFARFHAVTEDEQRALIQALRTPARQLWDSYRTSNVRANYTAGEIQAVYLLRYYLPYSQMLPYVLSRVQEYTLPHPHVSACFVGAGPAPEVLGLTSFLRNRNYAGTVGVHLVDRTLNEWEFSRSVTFDRLLPVVYANALAVRSEEAIDLCDGRIPPGTYDIVVFQNCFNEILGRDRFDHQMLRRWSTAVNEDGLLVLIDRTGYDDVDAFMASCELELAVEQMTVAVALHGAYINARPIFDFLPEAVKGALLYYARGGLIDRTSEKDRLILQNDVPFVCMAFRKQG